MALDLTAQDIADATGLKVGADYASADAAWLCQQAAGAYARDAELWAESLIGKELAVVIGGYADTQDVDEAQAYEDYKGAVAKLAAAEAAYPGTLRAVKGGPGFISSTGWDQSRESTLRAASLNLPVEAWTTQAMRRLYALPGAPVDPSLAIYEVMAAQNRTGLIDTHADYGSHLLNATGGYA